MNGLLVGTERVLKSSLLRIFSDFSAIPAYAKAWAGTMLSKKLAWDVQVHAMTYQAEPDEEI